jgi:hypothetical protein
MEIDMKTQKLFRPTPFNMRRLMKDVFRKSILILEIQRRIIPVSILEYTT